MNHIQLEDYVHELYASVSILTPDRINMHDIAEKFSIRLHLWDECSESSFYKGTGRIFLDKRIKDNQRWKEFAGELCCILKNAGDRIDTIPPCKAPAKMKENHFTDHFCIPSFMLEKLKLPAKKKMAVAYISSTFKVDTTFAESRLNQWRHRSNCY
jgi:hypothetical protein